MTTTNKTTWEVAAKAARLAKRLERMGQVVAAGRVRQEAVEEIRRMRGGR